MRASAALPPRPLALDEDAALPEIDSSELPFGDEPKMRLPSFADAQPPRRRPSSASGGGGSSAYQSKLAPINQGKPLFEAEEKPLFERLVFNLTWGGILFLVLVEVFINTPLFQQVRSSCALSPCTRPERPNSNLSLHTALLPQVKPWLLKLVGDGQ